MKLYRRYHDDIMTWTHFLQYWPFLQGIHLSPADSPLNGLIHVMLSFEYLSVVGVNKVLNTAEWPLNWDAFRLIWRQCNDHAYFRLGQLQWRHLQEVSDRVGGIAAVCREPNEGRQKVSKNYIYRYVSNQGPDSIKRCCFASIGNPVVEIRRSDDRLISTMGFPLLVRQHLYIESEPRAPSQYKDRLSQVWGFPC